MSAPLFWHEIDHFVRLAKVVYPGSALLRVAMGPQKSPASPVYSGAIVPWAWLAPLRQIPEPRTVGAICALGLALRLFISTRSHGSNDIDSWQRFGILVSHYGLLKTYALDGRFNHPPLMGWYAALADSFTGAHVGFDFAFKVLPILASSATVFLVQRVGKLSFFWLLLFAISPRPSQPSPAN